ERTPGKCDASALRRTRATERHLQARDAHALVVDHAHHERRERRTGDQFLVVALHLPEVHRVGLRGDGREGRRRREKCCELHVVESDRSKIERRHFTPRTRIRRMPEERRYYGLDALRGVMMMLGIALHAATFYLSAPPPTLAPITDRDGSSVFDALFYFI